MHLISRFFGLVLVPFEFLGQIVFQLVRLLWGLGGKFLLSPWGLLLPITFLAALFLATQIDKSPKELAEKYAAELGECDEKRIPVLVEALLHLGEAGLPSLVLGLQSERESVFLACRDGLSEELKRYGSSSDLTERNRFYRLLSEALLHHASGFRPTARIAVDSLIREMLRNLAVSERSDQAASRDVARESLESQRTTLNCESLLYLIESTRKKILDPSGPMNEPTVETAARFSRRSIDTDLVASDGKPFQGGDSSVPGTSDRPFDPFSAARADRLTAYHESPVFRRQLQTPYPHPEAISIGTVDAEVGRAEGKEMLASMTTVRNSNDLPASSHWAEPAGKIAGTFDRFADSDPAASDLETETSMRHEFLPPDLLEISRENIPRLSSSRLMRLLQHPDERCVSEARKTLIARDGFREIHLKLAFRLYHPLPSVREEIVSMLPNVGGIQPYVWFSELLDDPNGNVRYRAASFLATSGDPKMQRLLIEKGKRDTDSRIVDLADRILENQRRRSKR